jgi:hypothetical protein
MDKPSVERKIGRVIFFFLPFFDSKAKGLTAMAYATCSSSALMGASPAADRERARARIWGSLTTPAAPTMP